MLALVQERLGATMDFLRVGILILLVPQAALFGAQMAYRLRHHRPATSSEPRHFWWSGAITLGLAFYSLAAPALTPVPLHLLIFAVLPLGLGLVIGALFPRSRSRSEGDPTP